ncbi:MAG: hypothetical protein ACQERN_08710 [Thermodesulfobacteriota bacterium]
MKTLTRSLLLSMICLGMGAPASTAGTAMDYFHVNRLQPDASEQSLTLYRPFLSDGKIYIRSRADMGKSALSAAYVSTDGGQSWENASFLSNGTISYGFSAEAGRSYDVAIKAVNRRGRTRDITGSPKRITVSENDIQSVLTARLAELVRAYEAGNPEKFMARVSEDFTGDKMNLDSAIRRDFTLLDNIDLQLSPVNIAVDDSGYAHISLNYTRSVVATRSGRSLQDKGVTEMVFTLADTRPRLYHMKNPVLFGVSDAANVAAGQVNTGQNNGILVVNDNGEAAVLPFHQAMDMIQGRGSSAFPSIPAPLHLVLQSGAVGQYIDLRFDLPAKARSTGGDAYEVLVEESRNARGPWQPVEKKPLDSAVRVRSEALSSKTGPLFYRVRIKKPDTGEKSLPSNVLKWQWNNG